MARRSYEGESSVGIKHKLTWDTAPDTPYNAYLDRPIMRSIEVIEKKISTMHRELQDKVKEQVRILRDLDRIQKERDHISRFTQ